MSETKDNNRPADVIRDGSLKATIWENHSEKNGTYYSTKLAKTYEDEDGKLRDTGSFSGTDLLRVSELARQAYTRSTELRRELRQDRQAEMALDNEPEDEGRDARRESHRASRESRAGNDDRRASQSRSQDA